MYLPFPRIDDIETFVAVLAVGKDLSMLFVRGLTELVVVPLVVFLVNV